MDFLSISFFLVFFLPYNSAMRVLSGFSFDIILSFSYFLFNITVPFVFSLQYSASFIVFDEGGFSTILFFLFVSFQKLFSAQYYPSFGVFCSVDFSSILPSEQALENRMVTLYFPRLI